MKTIMKTLTLCINNEQMQICIAHLQRQTGVYAICCIDLDSKIISIYTQSMNTRLYLVQNGRNPKDIRLIHVSVLMRELHLSVNNQLQLLHPLFVQRKDNNLLIKFCVLLHDAFYIKFC